jgi:hypothetical protein
VDANFPLRSRELSSSRDARNASESQAKGLIWDMQMVFISVQKRQPFKPRWRWHFPVWVQVRPRLRAPVSVAPRTS